MLPFSCGRFGGSICKRHRQSPLRRALRAQGERQMLRRSAAATIASLVVLLVTPAFADVVYNNLTPNNLMATATRPDTAPFEIEAGDDFALPTGARINSASFDGLLVPNPTGGATSI